MGGANVTYDVTGFDDILYDYINGNPIARQVVDTNDAVAKNGTDTHSHYKDLPKETVRRFNWLYKNDGPEAAYEYIDTVTDKDYTGIQALLYGAMKGTGTVSIAETLGSGAAFLLNDDEMKKKLSEEHVKFEQDLAGAREQHPVMAGVGEVGGNLMMLSTLSSGIGTAGKALGAGEAATTFTGRAVNSAATFMAADAVRNAGAVSTGNMSPEEYGKSVAISGAQGLAGGLAEGLVNTGISTALTKSGLMTPFMEFVRQTSSGFAAASANIGTGYALREEKPTKEQMATDFVTAFLFSVIRGAISTSQTTQADKARLENSVGAIGQKYEQMAQSWQTMSPAERAAMAGEIIDQTRQLQGAMNSTYIAGQQETVNQLNAALDYICTGMESYVSGIQPYQPAAGGTAVGGSVAGGPFTGLPTTAGRTASGAEVTALQNQLETAITQGITGSAGSGVAEGVVPVRTGALPSAGQAAGTEIAKIPEATGAAPVPEAHSPEMQKVMKEYEAAVDPEILELAEKYRENPSADFERKNISPVGKRQQADLERILGGDFSGYTNAISKNGFIHTEKRHGISGAHDHSMANLEDVARTGYVLDHYDTVEQVFNPDGTPALSKELRNKNNKPSYMVRYSKRVDGTVHVIEAVADNAYKKLWVVTTYKNRAGGITQALDAVTTTPRTTSETPLPSLPSANASIPGEIQNVNVSNEEAAAATRQAPEAPSSTTPHAGVIATDKTGDITQVLDAVNTAPQGQNVNPGVFGEASLHMTPMEALQRAQNVPMGRNTLQENGGIAYEGKLAEPNGAGAGIVPAESGAGYGIAPGSTGAGAAGGGTTSPGQVALSHDNPGWRNYERETRRHERVPEAVRNAGRTKENRIVSQQRREAVKDYDPVSPEELGVPFGSSAETCLALPESEWDGEIQRGVAWAYSKGIKNVVPVVGEILLEQDGRSGSVVGTINEVSGEIFVRCDTVTTSFSENLEHEVAHQMTAPNDAAAFERQVRERFGEKAWTAIFHTYRQRYSTITNGFAGMEEAEIADYISEEIMADAFSGADKFGAKASLYGAIADEVLEGNVLKAQLPTAAQQEGHSRLSENAPEVRGPPEELTGKQEGELRNQERSSMDESAVRFSISEELPEELNAVLSNIFPSEKSEVVIGETSDYLVNTLHAQPLRVTMPANKAYAAMVTEDQAKQAGRYNSRLNYHGLGRDKLIRVLAASENPLAAFVDAPDSKGNSRDNRIVLVTDELIDGKNAVVITEMNSRIAAGNRKETVNKDITVYPRGQAFQDILRANAEGRLLDLDKKKSHQSLGFLAANSLAAIREDDFSTNIRNFWENVNYQNSGNRSNSFGSVENTAMRKAFEDAGWDGEPTVTQLDGKVNSVENVRFSVPDEDEARLTEQESGAAPEAEEKTDEQLTAEIAALQQQLREARKEMRARKGEKASPQKVEKKPIQESKPILAKRDLKRNLLSLFSIPEGRKAELGNMIDSYADRLRENGQLTQEDRDAFFDRMYEEGVMEVPADSYFQEAREAVRGRKIYVNDSVRAEFGDDWGRFARQAFNSQIYLTNDPNDAGPDVWNQELAEVLPGLFDDRETDSRAMLERIVQVAEEGKAQKMSLAEYASSLAEEGYVSEDEVLDNLERQMDWALRTYAEKASLEVHLRDRTGVKLAQERAKRKESMERQRENRELRELQKKTLKQLRWISKNQMKAPADLKQAFQDVLGDIDILAVGAANEMNWSDKYNATWKDLKEMYQAAQKNDPNFLPSPELQKIVDRLDKEKIGEMDVGALQDLYRAAVGLRTEFYNRRNVIDDDKNRLFEEVYRGSKEEIEAAGKGFRTGVAGALGKLFNYEEMTPMNVLEMMGGWDPDGTFFSMAKQLEKGERDMRDYEVRAKRMLDGFIQEHKDWIKKADGQGKDAIWYEIEVPELMELNMGDKPIFGDTVKVYMTPAQKVHMYLESKNYDNLRHMAGGRTFANKKLYSRGKRTEAFAQGVTVKLAPETVKKLVADLTPEEEELAKVLEEYYNTFAAGEINRVSNTLYGYDKAVSKNYAPIYTNQNYTKSEIGVFNSTAEGVGNLKARQYSKNPSYNLGAFDAFERHIRQTARFVGMAIPARNWNTLLNWREQSNSMADVITHRFGEEGKKYITDLINSLQGGGELSDKGVVDRFTDKMLSKYVSAVFGFNPGIVFKQAASFPQFASALGWKNLSLGRVDENLINTYTSELAYRKLGYATPETALLKNNPGKLSTNKAYQFMFGGGAITAMDAFTVKRAWTWAEKKVRNEYPELETGTPEQIAAGESLFYKKVAEEWEEAVSLTQPMYDEMHRANIMKGSKGITRAFTMFKTVPLQQYNTLRRNLGELGAVKRKYGKDKIPGNEKAKRRAKEKVRKASWKAAAAITATIGSILALEAVEFLNQLWKNRGKKYRDEEGNLAFESIMERVLWDSFGDAAGIVTFGGEIADVIESKITGGKWYGIEIPGGEQLDDVIDSVGGAGNTIEKFIADSFDVVSNGGDWGEYVRRNAGDYLGAVKEILEKASMYLGGFPIENIEKYLLGSLPEEIRAQAESVFDTPTKSDLKGLSGGALEARTEYLFGVRNVQIDEGTAEKLSELYHAQLTDAIPADTPSKVTVGEEERALTAYQKQTYDRVWGGIVQDCLDSLVGSGSFQKAEPEVQAKMLKKLYSYADAKAKSVLYDDFALDKQYQNAERIIEAGGTADQWAAWTAESSGMKAEKKYLLLADEDFSDEVKKAMVGNEIGTELKTESGEDSQYAKMLKLLESGMDMTDYLLLKAQGSDAVNKLGKFLDEGMEADSAHDIAQALDDLEDDAATVEKYMAIAETPYPEEVKSQALKAIMSDSAYAKYQRAAKSKISTYTYCKFLRDVGKYSGEGKQEKVWAYINALPLSLAQKDTLHLSMYKESSLKKAPWH